MPKFGYLIGLTIEAASESDAEIDISSLKKIVRARFAIDNIEVEDGPNEVDEDSDEDEDDEGEE